MTWRDLRQELIWLAIILIRQITHKAANNCQNCQMLGEILDWTEKELKRTRKELEDAKAKLRKIKALSEAAAKGSASEMGAGNVPQGKYGYLKGQNDLSNRVLSILGLKPHKPQKNKLKIVTNWLGRL